MEGDRGTWVMVEAGLGRIGVLSCAAAWVRAGSTGRVGPNLHGVIGGVAGSHPDLDHSSLLTASGETGVVWEKANTVTSLMNLPGHLREALGDGSGRSGMARQVRDEPQARDLQAFLATASPGAEGDASAE